MTMINRQSFNSIHHRVICCMLPVNFNTARMGRRGKKSAHKLTNRIAIDAIAQCDQFKVPPPDTRHSMIIENPNVSLFFLYIAQNKIVESVQWKSAWRSNSQVTFQSLVSSQNLLHFNYEKKKNDEFVLETEIHTRDVNRTLSRAQWFCDDSEREGHPTKR